MRLNERIEQIRTALADYMEGEGCGCCGNRDVQREAELRLAVLLNVKPYDDNSGADFRPYRSGAPR